MCSLPSPVVISSHAIPSVGSIRANRPSSRLSGFVPVAPSIDMSCRYTPPRRETRASQPRRIFPPPPVHSSDSRPCVRSSPPYIPPYSRTRPYIHRFARRNASLGSDERKAVGRTRGFRRPSLPVALAPSTLGTAPPIDRGSGGC